MKFIRRSISFFVSFVIAISIIAGPIFTSDSLALESTGYSKFDDFINDSRWTADVSWGANQRPKLSPYNSWSCCAYCADFVKYCYGIDGATWGQEFYSVSEIQAGDVILVGNGDDGNGHWFVVLKRSGNSLYTAEGSYASRVRIGWHYSISGNSIAGSSYSFTLGYHYGTPQPHDHNYSACTITKAPTTTQDGTCTLKCSCGASESFTIPALRDANIRDGIYRIAVTNGSGLYVSATPNQNQTGGNIAIYSKSSTDSQFTFMRNSDGTYTIYNGSNVLDVSGANFKGNVQLYTPNGTDAQKWYVTTWDNGYRLVNKAYYLNMDICGNRTDAGTNIQTWTHNGSAAQIFNLELVECINHTWNSGTVTKQPAVGQTGIMTYTCTGCGKTKTETIPALESSITITNQPANYTGKAGTAATFSVTAQGTGLTYQWQVYFDGAWKNSNAAGAKTAYLSFTVTSDHDGMKYRCIIKDSYGKQVTSNTVTVSVIPPLTVTKQPSNYTGTVGSTAAFSVTAKGTGLTYQWQVYSDGAWKSSNAAGAKTSNLSFKVTSSHNGMKYRCIIKDGYGQKATSNTVTVKVSTPLTITKQPANYSGTVGSTATFGVTAQGSGLKYQWQVYTNGVWKNSNAAGATTSKLSFKATKEHDGMKYRCILKDSYGQKITSNPVYVHVASATTLKITKQPGNYSGAVGKTAFFSVTAQGTGLKYQWQVYSNGAWKNSAASSATTSKLSFTITQSHNGMKYRCIVKDKNGVKVISNTVTVKVVNTLAITKQPVNYTGSAGSTASFSVTANGEGLTYQWQVYSNGAWKNSGASGSTTSKITFKATKSHNGMKYRCVIVDKNGKSVVTNAATITVK